MDRNAFSKPGNLAEVSLASLAKLPVAGRVPAVVLRGPRRRKWPRHAFRDPALQATSRLRKNANYFKVNYLIVMLLCTAFTFVLHPSSLLVLALLAGSWIYVFLMRTTPLVISGRTLR